MLLNSALEYTTMRVQKNKEGLEMNGTHQLLIYAGVIYMVKTKINIKKTQSSTRDY
jgi:hypothetical protein